MPLLGSLATHLILAVTLVLAAAVAGIMAYHYAKARFREKRGYAFDPVAEAPPSGSVEQRAKSAEEISEIRARIEALMEQQHIRSETENQHLAQKLDEIRTHMSTQDRRFDGLKSELRHEIHRRNGELDELRHQLASALDAFWKSMPALPGEATARALPPAAEPPAPSDAFAAVEPAAEREPAEQEPAEQEPAEAEARSGAPHEEEAPADPDPAERGAYVTYEDASPVEEATFVEVRFEADPYAEDPFADGTPAEAAGEPAEEAAPEPIVTTAPPAMPPAAAPAPPTPLSWNAPFAGGDGAAAGGGTPPSEPQATPHAPAPPSGDERSDGDDLTVITGITRELQQALYAAGVTSLEGIARWSRADARRIGDLVGVAEEVIMHQWIFEAQSVLFEQYQALMTQEA